MTGNDFSPDYLREITGIRLKIQFILI